MLYFFYFYIVKINKLKFYHILQMLKNYQYINTVLHWKTLKRSTRVKVKPKYFHFEFNN